MLTIGEQVAEVLRLHRGILAVEHTQWIRVHATLRIGIERIVVKLQILHETRAIARAPITRTAW